MSPQQRHRDIAAYALGVLEPADAFRFEEHLAQCVMCTVQLSDFTSTAASLAELAGPARVEATVSPGLLDRLTGEVALERHRSRRRRLRLVAAAAALIVALPVAAVALRDGGSGPARQEVAAKDARTGVSVSAALQDRQWGTAVSLHVWDVKGPRTCTLVAVGKNGTEHPVLSWAVPEGGYGIAGSPGHEEPLDIEGGTDLPSGEIARWEVRAADGQPLVTLTG